MKTREWRFDDKVGWPDGPWKDEPDKIQFTDKATGLPCLIHRNYGGALCGYVGVTEGHPWFEKHYDEVMGGDWDEDDFHQRVSVHGGLTFSSFCKETDEETGQGICHVPDPGEPQRVWWLGFDCAHSGDLCPGYDKKLPVYEPDLGRDYYGSYKDVAYVKAEIVRLARQASEALAKG